MVSPELESTQDRPITTVDEIISVCSKAEVIQSGLTSEVNKIACHTKDIAKKGTMFCAINGGGPFYGHEPGGKYKFDFHKHIPVAVEEGATGILLERVDASIPTEVTVVRVPNVIKALGELTGYQLEKNSIEVCGVTGSTGKSTVCELTASVLRVKWPTFKGLTNRSTPVSVPRMLLNAPLTNFEKVVVEMPMDGLGQIKELCKIAPPIYGIVFNVNDSHIKQLGTIEAITEAKAEMIESLKEGGVAILNADDKVVFGMHSKIDNRVILFGQTNGAHVRASNVQAFLTETTFNLEFNNKKRKVQLSLLGTKSIYSALASASVGFACGLNINQVCDGLEDFEPLQSRLSVLRGRQGTIVLDDTRLATPESSLSMLSSISEISRRGERRILIQGSIMRSYQHGGVKKESFNLMADGFDYVLLVGDAYNQFAPGINSVNPDLTVKRVDSPEDGALKASVLSKEGDFIVVDGSEQARMGRAVENLVVEEDLGKIYRK